MDETTRELGGTMRALREGAGLRQEDIARAGREYRLGWGRSSVAQLEAGTRTMTAHELLRLPYVLKSAGIEGVSLESLVREAGLKVRRMRRVDAPDETDRKAARALGVHPQQLAREAQRLWRGGLSAERDRRVAKRTDETTPRRRLQALRGHVTRELLAELRRHIGEGGKR